MPAVSKSQAATPACCTMLGAQTNVNCCSFIISAMMGAGPWAKFAHVTMPMISPIIFFNTVMQIIVSFQIFTPAYVMTRGGPNNASLFVGLYLYQNAFRYFQMGYAAALAWLVFVIIMALTLIVIRTSPLWVYYEGGASR